MNELDKKSLELLNGNPLPDSIIRWLPECSIEELQSRQKVILDKLALYSDWLIQIEETLKNKKENHI